MTLGHPSTVVFERTFTMVLTHCVGLCLLVKGDASGDADDRCEGYETVYIEESILN